ncbi:hypothetical protein LWP59_40025 [Amycolatopsis acidiphila]|uniref:DUF320 domain-containing protein n=1 Tax=Amycolatopsis acidiphila TaxID=715473 RepID=A0A558A6N1_9PSEU|nr:hypothetical protein [Amycolatopsis acidiphila]TVT19917.1 hypothetical protein FNH06_22330 [Amycolatopsis acidiphila]UIJ60090.1 hypothetical protein LWP59_40025 [Amycolatopsis acidiphila]GHG61422.1 hypothetical protein GCM10017788_16110 [Amycolatopsis acidiphila]
MQGRTRKVAAVGAAAFVLAGSAVLATPGTAGAAETITAKCGDTVTAHPGDTIKSPLGLQTVTDGLTSIVGGLLSGLCKITVNVVDTVVAPVPVVGPPAAGAIDKTVAGATNGTTSAIQGAAGRPAGGNQQPAQQNPPSGGSAQSGPGSSPGNQGANLGNLIPGSSSPVLGGGDPGMFSLLPFGSTGYAPMRDYSNIPYALAGLFAPSPGVRYGGQIPGYAPEVGALGDDGSSQQGKGVQNAGQAEALPSDGGTGLPGDVGLPMLIAVLALSGVSAALVRTWVLRGGSA